MALITQANPATEAFKREWKEPQVLSILVNPPSMLLACTFSCPLAQCDEAQQCRAETPPEVALGNGAEAGAEQVPKAIG